MSGYVYLIGTPIFRWYKIGKSKTPEIRIKNLGILLPFKIHVIGVWKADNHHLMESSLHELYAERRINGEWFQFTRKEIFEVFASIPKEALVYPIDSVAHTLDKFSNIESDIMNDKLVIGVRTEKLRGDFTLEERNIIRQTRIAEKAQLKAQGLTRHGKLRGGRCPRCDNVNPTLDKFCDKCGSPLAINKIE